VTPPTRRPIVDYLPEAYRAGGGVLAAFLAPVQEMFDELDRAVAGTDGTGGLPDLVDPAATPPGELAHRGASPLAFLDYLASWLAIGLRPEKPVEWNRRYLARAIELAAVRGTLPGVDGLLRAWLAGDLAPDVARELVPGPTGGSGARPAPLVTDLLPAANGVDTVFQLDGSRLGVDTVLGLGPPQFFVADIVVDPAVRDLHDPVGLDALQRSARALLDAEKPAATYYELRVRGRTMQLAPADPSAARPGEMYAQFEDAGADPPVVGTTLLWDSPWVFASSSSTVDT
jgi:phage tail-like protein